VLGTIMTIFRRAVGIGFCKIGKRIWDNTDFALSSDMIEDIAKTYDEQKAPKAFLIIGIVFALQGVVFISIALISKVRPGS